MFIQQGEYKEAFYVSVDADRKFVFTDFYPNDGEDIRIAYANSKKEFFKPKLYLNYDISDVNDVIENVFTIAETNRQKEPIRAINTNFLVADAEELDAVILEGKKKAKDAAITKSVGASPKQYHWEEED